MSERRSPGSLRGVLSAGAETKDSAPTRFEPLGPRREADSGAQIPPARAESPPPLSLATALLTVPMDVCSEKLTPCFGLTPNFGTEVLPLYAKLRRTPPPAMACLPIDILSCAIIGCPAGKGEV